MYQFFPGRKENPSKNHIYPMLNMGYKIKSPIAKYMVYWYDEGTNKNLKIVSLRLRFEKMEHG